MLDRPALAPVAERVLDHYRHAPPVWDAEFEAESQSFTEELLRDTDAADLVAWRVISRPAITVDPDDRLGWWVERGYHRTLSHGLDRLEKTPVQDWRLSDQ